MATDDQITTDNPNIMHPTCSPPQSPSPKDRLQRILRALPRLETELDALTLSDSEMNRFPSMIDRTLSHAQKIIRPKLNRAEHSSQLKQKLTAQKYVPRDNKMDFSHLHDSGKWSDVLIRYGKRGDKEFPGHRIFLCHYSEWFRKALDGGFKEAHENVVTLQGDNDRAIEAMLKYCYTSELIFPCRALFALDMIQNDILYTLQVLAVADKYTMDSLVDECIERVAHRFAKSPSSKLFRFVLQLVYDKGPLYMPQELKEEGMMTFSTPSSPLEEDDALTLEKWCLVPACPPLEGVKEVMWEVATRVWAGESKRFSLDELHATIEKIPEFGEDLMNYTFTKGLRLNRVSEVEAEES